MAARFIQRGLSIVSSTKVTRFCLFKRNQSIFHEVHIEATSPKQCEDWGPCKERENLFDYIMIARNLYKNSDVMLKANVKKVVDMGLLY